MIMLIVQDKDYSSRIPSLQREQLRKEIEDAFEGREEDFHKRISANIVVSKEELSTYMEGLFSGMGDIDISVNFWWVEKDKIFFGVNYPNSDWDSDYLYLSVAMDIKDEISIEDIIIKDFVFIHRGGFGESLVEDIEYERAINN